MPYYAHSKENAPLSAWQALESHLNETARQAQDFAQPFHSGDWAFLAGLWHDIGKTNPNFQQYILYANKLAAKAPAASKNHAGPGAGYILSQPAKFPVYHRIFGYLIAGHHAGLPDYTELDLYKTQSDVVDAAFVRTLSATRQAPSLLPEFVRKNTDSFHLWVRMLFSCLVDADYLDTQSFVTGTDRAAFDTLDTLRERFNRHMDALAENATPSDLNNTRANILGACRTAAHANETLFSLTVPTGGGKTLSSTAFALDYAAHHKKDRIIYVIPYLSIIEQTADILKNILGAGNVIEHHSNVAEDAADSNASSASSKKSALRRAAENYDAPVVVTTAVQFFESLYANKPSRCRKLHNLANSVIILDEAQLLPPELLKPCTHVLDRLTQDYGSAVLLSTATQPALEFANSKKPYEIIQDVPALYKQLKRTQITFPSDLHTPVTWESLAAELTRHPQVLCIVNTRKSCYELWKQMPEGTLLLSASLCGEHRAKIIRQIKSKLKNNEPVRVISTQLVEAGVDIDFPVVYRALAGMDSIVQAAGRCNREGKLQAGEVRIFVPPASGLPSLIRKGIDTTVEMAALNKTDMDAPQTFTRYFALYNSRLNEKGEEFLHKNFFKDVRENGYIKFHTAAQEFKFIQDTVPILVQYGKGNELIERLRQEGPGRGLLRALQRYCVNLHDSQITRLEQEQRVKKLYDSIYVQQDSRLYDAETGLDLYTENYTVQDLIV